MFNFYNYHLIIFDLIPELAKLLLKSWDRKPSGIDPAALFRPCDHDLLVKDRMLPAGNKVNEIKVKTEWYNASLQK